MLLKNERKKIVEYGIKTFNSCLNSETSGNLSIYNKNENLIAISPSGIDYLKLNDKSIVIIDINGNIIQGQYKPSSETDFHVALYKKRNDINSIVHTHSIYATTIACLNIEIPAIHYLIALAGKKVPIASYAEFGSGKLAENICKNIKNYNAVLLANHGLVSLGSSIKSAYLTAKEIEFVARIYYQANNIGKPVILSNDEMEKVEKKFKTYGNKIIKK
ncbi:MAG: fuculose phosphate aldolase [Desulfobacteraceae bacterium 4572_130]|nr:MAG: fuculose phosphate aldolase [Desulfobacteraceae bacterium 4572_130]